MDTQSVESSTSKKVKVVTEETAPKPDTPSQQPIPPAKEVVSTAAAVVPSSAAAATAATTDQNQGDAAKEKEPKPKKKKKGYKGKRKGKPGKIHIRLPSFEAYQKEICFPAEAPGRVVVRLERLMGSDKIKPVDGKYMETLIQRLEEEEILAFDRKIQLRKKAEMERHRQLAINGLMEPGPGMEDLYDHPVFRVNRILNRLAKLDHSFFAHQMFNLPPIENIDPFKDDDTGAFFKEYPFHKELKAQCQKYKDVEVPAIKDDEEELEEVEEEEEEEEEGEGEEEEEEEETIVGEAKSNIDVEPSSSKSKQPSKKETKVTVDSEPPPPPQDDEEEDDELEVEETDSAQGIEDEEEEQETEWDRLRAQFEKEYNQSLTTLQNKYECPQMDNFEEMWKPYRSEIVEKLYSDYEAMEEIYDAGREVVELYVRQDIVVNEHIKTGHEPFAYPASSSSTMVEWDEEEDEDEEGAEASESMPQLSEVPPSEEDDPDHSESSSMTASTDETDADTEGPGPEAEAEGEGETNVEVAASVPAVASDTEEET